MCYMNTVTCSKHNHMLGSQTEVCDIFKSSHILCVDPNKVRYDSSTGKIDINSSSTYFVSTSNRYGIVVDSIIHTRTIDVDCSTVHPNLLNPVIDICAIIHTQREIHKASRTRPVISTANFVTNLPSETSTLMPNESISQVSPAKHKIHNSKKSNSNFSYISDEWLNDLPIEKVKYKRSSSKYNTSK